jgi:cytochrome c nitrite reductase small subunit
MTADGDHASGRRRLALLVCACLGALAGLGLFTFSYAEGTSYLSDDPAACANCHVMQDHFDAWQRGSHHTAAVCNDCHAPPELVPKYAVKAINGWNHSVAFTTGRFADPFQITPMNVEVAERSCRGCHAELAHVVDLGAEPQGCLRCHEGVGH